MRTPEAMPIYAKRACPAAKFGKARGALLLVASFFLALIPWSLDCVLADTPELGTPFTVKALQSQCFADTPSPGDYPEADLSFIEYLANSAGIGATGNVVATSSIVTSSIGIVAVTTGINLTKTTGAQMGAQLSTCLDSLADAADFPPYTELSAQQQAAWGSVDNYNAAKFNSFLNAFGLGEAAQRYKQGFTGSGGGHGFSFTEQEQNKVDRLGRIVNNWITGVGNTVGDLKDFFNDKSAIENWLPQTSSDSFDFSEVNGWSPSYPTYVNAAKTNSLTWILTTYNDTNQTRMYVTGGDTYIAGFVYPSTYTTIQDFAFSKTQFSYSVLGNTGSGTQYRKNGQTFYMAAYNLAHPNIRSYVASQAINEGYIPSEDDRITIAYNILYGDIANEGEAAADEVEDYPEQPNENQNTWIPAIGLFPNISWPQLTTPNVSTPSESPYNPDWQTDTPEWNNEATNNLLHLSDIKFDKLFPFCLLFDISLLFNKVQSTIVDDGNSYNVLDVPFDYGVDDEDMTVNLTWLHDLALMIRPFVQILLAALLLFVTIWFWKGILAG